MWIKALLIITGIPILILPIISKIKNDKNLTAYGYLFLILVLIFTALQFENESINAKNEKKLSAEKDEMKNKVDSLNMLSKNLTDSIHSLKYVLLSLDDKYYQNNKKVLQLSKSNDSLTNLVFISERPVFSLSSSKIVKYDLECKYWIDFTFLNEGKRSATNVYGKLYIFQGYFNPKIRYDGTLTCSLRDIYSNNRGFTMHKELLSNPDSVNYELPIYFYFQVNYSEITIDKKYHYDVVVRLGPFKKGKYLNDLFLCKEWELSHFRDLISQLKDE